MQPAGLLAALAARAPVAAPVVLVAAHPDDETIGAGALLHLFRRLTIVHVTDGAPRDLADAHRAGFASAAAYAAGRRRELEAALRAGGARPALGELGAPDQQASLRLRPLADALARLLDAADAALVIAHPYEGGHPDHDAACFIAHAACAGRPVVEMTSYHADPAGGLATGRFLDGPPGVTVALDAAEQARKRAMLDCFASQRDTLAPFGTAAEVFRPAPRYDFTRPPDAGTLHYERHDWGMTGARWRLLAAAALAEAA